MKKYYYSQVGLYSVVSIDPPVRIFLEIKNCKNIYSQVGLHSVLWPVCKDSQGASPICKGRFLFGFQSIFFYLFSKVYFYLFRKVYFYSSIFVPSPFTFVPKEKNTFDSLPSTICQGIKTFTLIEICQGIKTFTFIPVC